MPIDGREQLEAHVAAWKEDDPEANTESLRERALKLEPLELQGYGLLIARLDEANTVLPDVPIPPEEPTSHLVR